MHDNTLIVSLWCLSVSGVRAFSVQVASSDDSQDSETAYRLDSLETLVNVRWRAFIDTQRAVCALGFALVLTMRMSTVLVSCQCLRCSHARQASTLRCRWTPR